jgi:hypothetical protein
MTALTVKAYTGNLEEECLTDGQPVSQGLSLTAASSESVNLTCEQYKYAYSHPRRNKNEISPSGYSYMFVSTNDTFVGRCRHLATDRLVGWSGTAELGRHIDVFRRLEDESRY